MIRAFLDRHGIHLHKHDEIRYQDDMDRISACRCGHLQHEENPMHEYVYKRRHEFRIQYRAKLYREHAQPGDFYDE